jgi:hypothetical protein
MPDPVVAHEVPIHLTPLSSTTLADANKVEETTTFSVSIASEQVERKNLNSDGWTKVSSVWRSGSGSMDGNVVHASATQATMQAANLAGTAAYVHVIHTPAATVGLEKGTLYKVKFESYEESSEAGGLKTFTASFKLDGAPTSILAAA